MTDQTLRVYQEMNIRWLVALQIVQAGLGVNLSYLSQLIGT